MPEGQRKFLEALQDMLAAIGKHNLRITDIEAAVKDLPHKPAIATALTMVSLGVLTAHASEGK